MKNYIKLLRPHQYVKNLFVFMPLFFAGLISDIPQLINAAIAFVAFSLAASAIYILNDYMDIEADRLHPKKKNRPLASGAVSAKVALITMVLLLIMSSLLLYFKSIDALIILTGYVVMNIAYSLRLKHIAILDVTIIAVGFNLRIFIGATITNTNMSMWIVLMTFLLALFLALAKRRDDVLMFESTGKKMRKVVSGYNLQFIDTAMMIMASVVIVAYVLYTTSAQVVTRINNEYLYLTSLFVIVGIMRYLQIVFVEKNSGSPTRIALTDRFLQTTILCWLLSFVWILYL